MFPLCAVMCVADLGKFLIKSQRKNWGTFSIKLLNIKFVFGKGEPRCLLNFVLDWTFFKVEISLCFLHFHIRFKMSEGSGFLKAFQQTGGPCTYILVTIFHTLCLSRRTHILHQKAYQFTDRIALHCLHRLNNLHCFFHSTLRTYIRPRDLLSCLTSIIM